MEFTTSDKDNDAAGYNCADYIGGANWWRSCGSNNMNGKYGGNGDSGRKFMSWYYFDYDWQALRTMTLMFRQVD